MVLLDLQLAPGVPIYYNYCRLSPGGLSRTPSWGCTPCAVSRPRSCPVLSIYRKSFFFTPSN